MILEFTLGVNWTVDDRAGIAVIELDKLCNDDELLILYYNVKLIL